MKQYKMAKLVSGDIVIGVLDDTNPDYLTEVYALTTYMNTEYQVSNSIEFLFIPLYYPFVDDSVDIEIKDVMISINCPEEYKTEYIKFTSGLIL